MNELKKCPFCGGEAKFQSKDVQLFASLQSAEIICLKCKASTATYPLWCNDEDTMNFTIARVKEQWNKRYEEKV